MLGDEMSLKGTRTWTPIAIEIGTKFDPTGRDLGWRYRRPLKSAVAARSASTNSRCDELLWKELRRRNGGKFPAKQDWIAVTKNRFDAAIKAAQSKSKKG